MQSDKDSAKQLLDKFSGSLREVEGAVEPMLLAIDGLRATANEDELDAMTRARLHITLCYTTNTLFCMYLRTQGIDPLTHPVADEMTRVQEAFMRMRKVEAGVDAGHQPPADRDRRRHIENAKVSEGKLRALIFPEEGQLLRALLNMKDRSKKKGNKKEDEKKTDVEGEGAEIEIESDGDSMEHIRATEDEMQEMQDDKAKRDRKQELKESKKRSKAEKKITKKRSAKKKAKERKREAKANSKE